MGDNVRLGRSVRIRLFSASTALMALGALGLTACSSSSHSAAAGGSSATSGSPPTSQGSGSNGSAPSAGSSPSLQAADQAAQQLLVRPTTLNIPALPSKPPAGKTVDIIACGVPACQSYVPIARAALAQVGWNLVSINSGLTPQTVDAAYDQAVRNKPAGVIGTGGVDPSVFAHQLAELKAEGVPVVLQLVTPTTVPGVTATVLTAQDEAQYGTDLAEYLLSVTGGQNAHVLVVTTPATPVYADSHPTFTSTLLKDCSTCSVDTFSFPETAVGTTLPSMIVSYLRTHSSINYLNFDWGDMSFGVPAALEQAGLASKVKIITQGIDQTLTSYIAAGQVLAEVNDDWYAALWNEVNLILRYNMHLPLQPAEAVQLPTMITTKANLVPTTATNPYFPIVADYQQAFDQAWHVSS